MSNNRHDWSREEILCLFARPFNDLLFDAQSLHRQHFDPNAVQVSSLLSVKPGPAQRIVVIVRKVPTMKVI